jgi:hypothetical protein
VWDQKQEEYRKSPAATTEMRKRVRALQPWAITGPQVLGTPKTGEWEHTYIDVLEIGERGWAYAVRLKDGIFGWLPEKFVEPVEEDPAPSCEDATAAAQRWFEKINQAVFEEALLPGEESWQVSTADAPKLDADAEAAALAAAWIAKHGPDSINPDDPDAEPRRNPFTRRDGARARCLSPDDAAAYLGIPDDD